MQAVPDPPDAKVIPMNNGYEGELCPYCERRYAYPVEMHHTVEECEFWEQRKT